MKRAVIDDYLFEAIKIRTDKIPEICSKYYDLVLRGKT